MKSLMLLTAGAAALVFAMPADAQHRNMQHRYGAWGNNCPPGLAKRNNNCQPPGIAKRHYNTGQRWAGNAGTRWSYSQVPMSWRTRYQLNSSNSYYYRDGYLYSVDPTTQLVREVIRAVL